MSDVGAYVFAKWGIVPEYVVSFSVLRASCIRSGYVVQSVLVSVFVECFMVWR